MIFYCRSVIISILNFDCSIKSFKKNPKELRNTAKGLKEMEKQIKQKPTEQERLFQITQYERSYWDKGELVCGMDYEFRGGKSQRNLETPPKD